MTRLLRLGIGSWIFLRVAAGPVSADPFQVWYQNTTFVRLDEQWSVGSYFDLRVTDAVRDYTTGMISPRVRYDFSPEWSGQINTSWVNAFSVDGRTQTDFFRLEFEMNPRYQLGSNWIFSARNRFELRWADGVDGMTERIRVRPQLEWKPPWGGPITGIFANNEVFYDFDQERITENRLTPFGIVTRPGDFVEVRIYYLWRHTRFGNRWYDFHVLGLLLNLNF